MTVARWVEIRPGIWIGYKRSKETVEAPEHKSTRRRCT